MESTYDSTTLQETTANPPEKDNVGENRSTGNSNENIASSSTEIRLQECETSSNSKENLRNDIIITVEDVDSGQVTTIEDASKSSDSLLNLTESIAEENSCKEENKLSDFEKPSPNISSGSDSSAQNLTVIEPTAAIEERPRKKTLSKQPSGPESKQSKIMKKSPEDISVSKKKFMEELQLEQPSTSSRSHFLDAPLEQLDYNSSGSINLPDLIYVSDSNDIQNSDDNFNEQCVLPIPYEDKELYTTGISPSQQSIEEQNEFIELLETQRDVVRTGKERFLEQVDLSCPSIYENLQNFSDNEPVDMYTDTAHSLTASTELPSLNTGSSTSYHYNLYTSSSDDVNESHKSPVQFDRDSGKFLNPRCSSTPNLKNKPLKTLLQDRTNTLSNYGNYTSEGSLYNADTEDSVCNKSNRSNKERIRRNAKLRERGSWTALSCSTDNELTATSKGSQNKKPFIKFKPIKIPVYRTGFVSKEPYLCHVESTEDQTIQAHSGCIETSSSEEELQRLTNIEQTNNDETSEEPVSVITASFIKKVGELPAVIDTNMQKRQASRNSNLRKYKSLPTVFVDRQQDDQYTRSYSTPSEMKFSWNFGYKTYFEELLKKRNTQVPEPDLRFKMLEEKLRQMSEEQYLTRYLEECTRIMDEAENDDDDDQVGDGQFTMEDL